MKEKNMSYPENMTDEEIEKILDERAVGMEFIHEDDYNKIMEQLLNPSPCVPNERMVQAHRLAKKMFG